MKASLLNPETEGADFVFLHGYGADSFTWLTTTPALIDRARLWLFDLPGHGRNEAHGGPGTMADLCHCLEAGLSEHQLSNAHLIGHSLGGRLAMAYAQRHPDRVNSLFLLSPAGIGGSINRRFLEEFHSAREEADMTRLLRTLVHDPRLISRGLARRVISYLNLPDRRAGLSRIAQALTASQSDLGDLIEDIGRLTMPRCIVWGREDRINRPPPDMTVSLDADWHLLGQCGHLPHLERATMVNRLLREFIGVQAR